jgi:hypothetical protein
LCSHKQSFFPAQKAFSGAPHSLMPLSTWPSDRGPSAPSAVLSGVPESSRSGERGQGVTHSNGDSTDDSPQVALDELGCRRRLEDRGRKINPLGTQSSHTLSCKQHQPARSLPVYQPGPLGEMKEVSQEVKGTQASHLTSKHGDIRQQYRGRYQRSRFAFALL